MGDPWRRVKQIESNKPWAPALRQLIEKRKAKLIKFADDGIPPAAAVGAEVGEFAKGPLKTDRGLRIFVGLVVRAIMDEAGYSPNQRSVRISGDRFITVGTTYKKRPALPPNPTLARFLDSLSEQDKEWARRYLKK